MLILAASLHIDGTPQGRTEEASCHCALSLLPRATLLQASWFTVTPAADGQASLQVSWGCARQKGPSPGRTLSPGGLGSAHSPSSETLSKRHTAFPAHSIPHFAGYRVFSFPCFVVQHSVVSSSRHIHGLYRPDSSAHGISQVRGLQWAAMSFSPVFPMKPLII